MKDILMKCGGYKELTTCRFVTKCLLVRDMYCFHLQANVPCVVVFCE